MIKVDVQVLNLPFASLKDSVIAPLNFPGMIHLVAFQNGGHDNNYPDFIPPAPRWGSTDDFADLVSAVHAKGGLAVPYTNISWWDNNGPMLTNLPDGVTLANLIVKDAHGLPDFETYGAHSGFVVDPNTDLFKDKVAEQFDALRDVGMDGIFEDQWGARDAPYDFNAASPNPSTGYFSGALAHFSDHAADHLFTEVGADVLARDAVGFMGTNYLWDMLGYRTTAAYTSYYPMAGMLLRDKVLLYQHDLASQTWTKNMDVLRWNLAQGYNLSNAVFDDTIPGLNVDNPWLNLVGVFQKYALANYADELVSGFDHLGDNVTRTSFSTYTVTANWDADQSYTVDGATLPPGGVITEADDGSVVAGVFTAYNQQPLSDGDHYLLIARSPDDVRVFQPVGGDTPIRLSSNWTATAVEAYRYDGSLIGSVDATISDHEVQFEYQSEVNGEPVGYYRVARYAAS